MEKSVTGWKAWTRWQSKASRGIVLAIVMEHDVLTLPALSIQRPADQGLVDCGEEIERYCISTIFEKIT